MIPPDSWHLVSYKFPRVDTRAKPIAKIGGLDTEAYEDGRPFMACLDNGKMLDPRDFPQCVFSFPLAHYATYNLKYDSGALLYYMPQAQKLELWETTKTKWDGVSITYIPHKLLEFRQNKKTVKVWDVCQYYAMSLSEASKKYLNDDKKDIETKKFSVSYVKKNHDRIKEYCIYDAQLCARLARYLIDKLNEFGIRVTALYSGAALSFRYFADHGRIVTVWRHWKYHKELLQYAVEAYQGGKFEVTARGAFSGYEYDITSAYPYEIKNLADISLCKVEKSSVYRPEALYGFLRVHIDNSKGQYIPCGLMESNVRIYSAGKFYTTITKAEYDYLIELGIDVEIISGYWLYVRAVKCPYEKIINTLFALKAKYKGKDEMLTEVSKRMMNSFYGKTVQAIKHPVSGNYIAGAAWNPIYGAQITAGTRLTVTRLQNKYKDHCLAVHTDSVLLDCVLDGEYITGKIGGFELVKNGSGPGLIIACGQYEIGEQRAFKGFAPQDGDTWRKILQRNKKASIISYPVIRVNTLMDAIAKGHFDKINLFENDTKEIDLNADIKRAWNTTTTAGKLLERRENSLPRITFHHKKPDYWN